MCPLRQEGIDRCKHATLRAHGHLEVHRPACHILFQLNPSKPFPVN